MLMVETQEMLETAETQTDLLETAVKEAKAVKVVKAETATMEDVAETLTASVTVNKMAELAVTLVGLELVATEVTELLVELVVTLVTLETVDTEALEVLVVIFSLAMQTQELKLKTL